MCVPISQNNDNSKCDNNRLASSKEDLIKKFFFNQPIKTFENFCEYKMLDLICKRKEKNICFASKCKWSCTLVASPLNKHTHKGSHSQAHVIFMLCASTSGNSFSTGFQFSGSFQYAAGNKMTKMLVSEIVRHFSCSFTQWLKYFSDFFFCSYQIS